MTEPAGDTPYEALILEQIPRVLSRMDRERDSPTAGSCDRTHWAWKFTDFPGARFQEAVCALSFVYATPFRGNPYVGNRRLRDWIHLALRYWTSIQHSDGSFDEAYPNERSLAATAFTTFYVAEALHFLRDHLDGEVAEQVQACMARSGSWLARNDESHGFLSNHLAAASAALHHVYLRTGDVRFRERSRYFLERILAHQSREGWFDEYGGADFGYQTHGSFYLARLQELEPQPALAEALARAVHCQGLFVHPDRSLGGEYASRNTQTYYPAAFEMLAATDPAAAWIAQTMRQGVVGSAAAGMRAVDAYNLCPMLNNLVFALRARLAPGRVTAVAAEPGQDQDFVWLPEAGIARIRRADYVAYVGASKGGVVKVFDRRTGHLRYIDCGYIGWCRDGSRVASQHFDRQRAVEVAPDRLEVTTSFVRLSRPALTPAAFVGFRLFSLILGRLPGAARWLKRFLVNLLIYRKAPIAVAMRRRIAFHERHVTVCDRFEGPGLKQIDHLRWTPSFTTIHMGSSRYFIASELDDLGFEAERSEALDAHRIANASVERTVRFD